MAIDNNSAGWNLFGYTISKKEQEQPKSFVAQTDDDGGVRVDSAAGTGAAYNSYSIDLDATSVKTESDLIVKYRDISLVADIDIAVDEIVNEFIIYDEYKDSVELDFTEAFVK